MRGLVTVQTAEEFQKWMEDTSKEQGEAADDPFR
jgi:heme/copper-type cytochrome/quinol oxidase subunit 2